ncbi:B12-binding domain-containing radical SAM protein [Endothiovibrio diazotrophicus]
MKKLKICLINPRFEPSYWGFDYALPLYPGDVRCTMVTGALPHLAGLTPGHEVRLLDENVEPLDFELLKGYDIVGVTGMNVQKERMREILLGLRERSIFTAVGGAYASVDEGYFDGLCDVLFSGEADTTWPAFIEQFAAGNPYESVYRQAQPTDMGALPPPRFDLLQVRRYATGSIQFSRGCPFRCEFCDIIVTFGRRPRMKRPEQIIEELDRLRELGFLAAFIVDDNFIGNKRAAKELLRAIVAWQRRHAYPLRLNTETTINLADDEELLDLLYEANFRSVFIGIETPRKESLEETKKFHNVSADGIESRLTRIQNAGIDINAGFIVGFDHDDESIFDDQFRFIQDNGILLAMVGMLTAIPKTPLYERLQQEGRLRLHDFNCNYVPKQMTPEQLQQGYWDLLRRLYAPEAFLERYFRIYAYPQFRRRRASIVAKGSRQRKIPTLVYGLLLTWNLFWTLVRERQLRNLGTVYWRYFWRQRRLYQKGVFGFAQFVNRCVTHWHFWKFTEEGTNGRLRMFNSG